MPEEEFGVGYVYREYGGIPPFKGESTWRVTVFEPMRRQVHIGDDGSMTLDLTIELDPTESGTRFTQRLEMKPRWYLRPINAVLWPLLMRKRAQMTMDRTVLNVKRIAGSGRHRDPKPDSLRVQLAELNNRSRWYSSQLWQVPFAYIGFAGLALSSIAKNQPTFQWLVFLGSFALGVAVLFHMNGMRDGVRRSVQNLVEVEEQLDLVPTAEVKIGKYLKPLELVVVLGTLGSLAGLIRAWLCTQFDIGRRGFNLPVPDSGSRRLAPLQLAEDEPPRLL